MAKPKRIIRRPYARKHRAGWIIQPAELLTALKGGQAVEIGGLHYGARQLADLIRVMLIPENQELLISTNGTLDIRNIQRYIKTRNGKRRTEFRLPKLEHSFRLQEGAWMPKAPQVTLVIKPKKYM